MKKMFAIVFFVCSSAFIYSQEILTERFHGYIFPQKGFGFQEFRGKSYERILIDMNDIEKAETLLSQYTKKYIPEIYSKLSKYKRQYFGITSQGRKIVFINLLILDGGIHTSNWKKELILVQDGGNNYFSLKIDISTEFCFDIEINGES